MRGARAKAHKLYADRYAMAGNAHKAAAHYKRAFEYGLRFGADEPQCFICLDSNPPPIPSGCACRGNTGLAHVGCKIDSAVAQQPHRGYAAWWECQTCKQEFTGPMKTGLAEAWWARVQAEAEESRERLAAADNLAQVRSSDGQYAEAEQIFGEVLDVKRRVLGNEHPDTLMVRSNLAVCLGHQKKHAEAERIYREVLAMTRRIFGEEHPHTLRCAGNLASSLSSQGKHADAERSEREVLGVRRRVLGEKHPDTLGSASNLALSLARQGKLADAEEILHATLVAQQRVLGNSHPDTLKTSRILDLVSSRMRLLALIAQTPGSGPDSADETVDTKGKRKR
jgi:tetratricopeptide (TPR) repeat protein